MEKVAPYLLIAGFVLFVIGGVSAPPGVYSQPELPARLEIIEAHPTRWLATNVLGGLGGLSTAAGFLVLGIGLYGDQGRAPVVLGCATAVVAGVAVAVQSYRRALDPAGELAGVAPMDRVWLGSFLLSLLAFGLVFLRAGYPRWLGYLMVGGAVLLGAGSVANLALAELGYLIPLIVAIVLLRSG